MECVASWGPSQASLGSKRKVGKCTRAVCCQSSPWAHCLSHSTLWLPSQQIFSSVGLGRHIPSGEVTSLPYLCNKSEFPAKTLCVSPWMFLHVSPSTYALHQTNMSEALLSVRGMRLALSSWSYSGVSFFSHPGTPAGNRGKDAICALCARSRTLAWHCRLHSCFT